MKTFLNLVLAGISMLGVNTLAMAQNEVPCSKVAGRTERKTNAIISQCANVQAVAAEENGKYRKYVSYNEDSGALFLKYEFVKNNEEFIYEKTVNAAEKSKEERKRIILEFEDEIAFPGRESHVNL